MQLPKGIEETEIVRFWCYVSLGEEEMRNQTSGLCGTAFFFFFFFFGYTCTSRHVGSWFPDRGLNPHPLRWKPVDLPTGPPGKSLLPTLLAQG